MLTPGEVKLSKNKVITDEIWSLQKMQKSNFDTSRIGRWYSSLRYFEKKKANALMHDNLLRLKYI